MTREPEMRDGWEDVVLNDVMDPALEHHLGPAIWADAFALARIDTGEMKDELYHQMVGHQLHVGGTAKHTAFNEFGTSKMSAQPMIRPAIYTRRVVRGD
jgi:HK97 gp10 family phage protein